MTDDERRARLASVGISFTSARTWTGIQRALDKISHADCLCSAQSDVGRVGIAAGDSREIVRCKSCGPEWLRVH